MSKVKSLEQYTAAMLAVAEYRKKHRKIFDELDSLTIAVQDAEEKLKADVKENIKANVANDQIKVTYSPAYKKWYDVDVVMGMTTPKMRKALEEAGAVKTELDKVKFEDLVEKGVIPVEVKQTAFKEKELAPRVSIKEVSN